MTAYIDEAGLRARFGDREIDGLIGANPDAVPPVEGDTQKIALACSDAQTLIDGFLGARYKLPLVNIPANVQAWAADVARYRLWDNRAPEEIRRRYEDAERNLRDVSRGLIVLPPDATGEQPKAGGGEFAGYSAERVFTQETLQAYTG